MRPCRHDITVATAERDDGSHPTLPVAPIPRIPETALVMDNSLSRPKLRALIFTPGGAWRRLYSLI